MRVVCVVMRGVFGRKKFSKFVGHNSSNRHREVVEGILIGVDWNHRWVIAHATSFTNRLISFHQLWHWQTYQLKWSLKFLLSLRYTSNAYGKHLINIVNHIWRISLIALPCALSMFLCYTMLQFRAFSVVLFLNSRWMYMTLRRTVIEIPTAPVKLDNVVRVCTSVHNIGCIASKGPMLRTCDCI